MSEHEDEIRAKCAYLIENKFITSPFTKESLICEMYELSLYRDAYLKMRSVVSEVCLYKIYEDYEFKSEQMSSYYTNPVVFPLVEFEKTAKRARAAIKKADEILGETK